VLRDVGTVETATTVLGTPLPAPILVAPTAYQRLAHPEGEVAVARGAAGARSLMVVSTRTSIPVERIAAAAPGGLRWFQVYVLQDRGWTAELIQRAARAGCTALVVTADTPMLGNRVRDRRNNFVLPPELLAAGLPVPFELDPSNAEVPQDPGLTFDDIEWLRGIADLPVVVKGVLRGDDAVACIDAGAVAVAVSNHGGRQLDTAAASADVLAEVADAVGERAEVYVDGGIRRGTDVIKAVALGARAVLVGRPVLWALATGGAEGVRALLEGMRDELAWALALCGVPSVAAITRDLVASPR
jgi:4-hydroxymandelate oxidase